MVNTTTQIRRLLWITILIGMAFVSLIVMLPSPTHALPAIELHVCLNGCPYASIQAAVDAAQPGDTVKVAAGTYTGVNVRPATM